MKAQIQLLFILCIFILFSTNVFSQTWQPKGADIEDDILYNSFGQDVTMNAVGSVIAVGAASDDFIAEDAGMVKVYEWNGSEWVQRGDNFPGEEENDNLGQGICLNAAGDILAVGAPEDYSSLTEPGYVKVFTWNGSDWIQMGQLLDGDEPDDRFGYAVKLDSSGHTLAIFVRSSRQGDETGHVSVYEWQDSLWSKKGTDLEGEVAYANLGWALDLSADGNIIALGGATGNAPDPGRVEVYEWEDTAWIQKGVDIEGHVGGEIFGFDLSLSSDGNVLAASARGNRTHGDYTGQVRVYQWNDSSWVQIGSELTGDSALNSFGWSVCLDWDGSTLAIGAQGNFITDTSSGYVEIYDWIGDDWVQAGQRLYGSGHKDKFGSGLALSAGGNIVACGGNLNSDGTLNVGRIAVYSRGISSQQNVEVFKSTKVYPNPTSGHLIIQLDDIYPEITLKLFNNDGQVVDCKHFNHTKIIDYKINTQSGMYFLEISTNRNREIIQTLKIAP